MEFTHLSLILLSIYFTMIAGVSFWGGKFSLTTSMTHTQTQTLMSFISGFIIGIAIYHLLLHSIKYVSVDSSAAETLEAIVNWMLLGIVALLLLLRTFPLHQHEPNSKGEKYSEHGYDPEYRNTSITKTSLLSLIMGLSLHSVMEGIALGASIQIDVDTYQNKGQIVLGSLGVFMAIVLHKPLDSYSIIGMLKSCGYSRYTCVRVNILLAILCPLMMVLTFWGVTWLHSWYLKQSIGYLLSFASGAFLCIALSDLLPEIQFHRHDRVKLTLAFLVGILLSYFLHFLTE